MGDTFMEELLSRAVQKALEEIPPHGVGGMLQRSAGIYLYFRDLTVEKEVRGCVFEKISSEDLHP